MKRLSILAVIVSLAGLTQIAQGQHRGFGPVFQGNARGVPPSVTSLAPGRQFLPGPSATSLGPGGFRVGVGFGHPRFFGRHGFNHRGSRGWYGGYAGYGVAYPYYPMYAGTYVYDEGYADPSAMYQPDPNYAGEYGLRDPRRNQPVPPPYNSNTPQSEQPPAENAQRPASAPVASARPAAAPKPQPSTVLVFKDGHKLEVTNYVIQGKTLFNFGDSGPRKVALADLDVDKTIAQNDDRGVEFRVP